jgi:hypothetical protein
VYLLFNEYHYTIKHLITFNKTNVTNNLILYRIFSNDEKNNENESFLKSKEKPISIFLMVSNRQSDNAIKREKDK